MPAFKSASCTPEVRLRRRTPSDACIFAGRKSDHVGALAHERARSRDPPPWQNLTQCYGYKRTREVWAGIRNSALSDNFDSLIFVSLHCALLSNAFTQHIGSLHLRSGQLHRAKQPPRTSLARPPERRRLRLVSERYEPAAVPEKRKGGG